MRARDVRVGCHLLVVAILARVFEELAARRANGASFEEAWSGALGRGVPTGERRTWIPVLEETRDAWRAAYCGEPAVRPHGALRALLVDPDREPLAASVDVDDVRLCDQCGGLIPATRTRRAQYCGHDCQREANGRPPRTR